MEGTEGAHREERSGRDGGSQKSKEWEMEESSVSEASSVDSRETCSEMVVE